MPVPRAGDPPAKIMPGIGGRGLGGRKMGRKLKRLLRERESEATECERRAVHAIDDVVCDVWDAARVLRAAVARGCGDSGARIVAAALESMSADGGAVQTARGRVTDAMIASARRRDAADLAVEAARKRRRHATRG